MADLSNLQIQITARTSDANQSIDRLIGKLSALNKALDNYAGNSATVSGLFNLASGLSQVGNATNGIDSTKLSAFADALGSLAKSGKSLSDLNLSALGTGLRNIQSVNISGDKFAGIKALSESLGKLTGANYEKAKTALPTLARSLSGFSKINIPNYGGKLVELANSLSKFGSKAMERAQGLSKVAEGLRQFDGFQVPKIEGLAELASSLSKFGNASMTKAINQMPQLATSFANLMASISSAPQVSMQTVRFAEAMASLASSSRSAGTAMRNVSDGTTTFRRAILSTIPAMNRTKRHTFSLAAMFGKLYASYFLVIRAFRGLGKAISVSAALTEVENVVASVFNNMSDKLDEFADTSIYKFGLAELSAKQYASRFQAMGNAMGITAKQVAESTDFLSSKLVGQKRDIEGVEDSYADLGDSMADMSINLTKLVSDYASFFNMDYDDVAKDFESIFTGSTRPMRTYGIDLTNATLQEWALKNGLDANVKAMTQAEKSMLRYQYVMAQSGKVMNDYQITMNNWANVIRTIGQQFTKLGSIIGQGLINTFKPVLIAFRGFMNTIIDLTQKALNAIGKLLGWQIEIEEVGFAMDSGMEDYADSIDEAAGNAKKLNAQLRSIDELNNLTTPNNGGGSGGGGLMGAVTGGESGATGGRFRLEKYQSDIDSWFELGKRIADKIKEGLDSIKWGEVFSKARSLGKNLAEFLNGLIQPETFYSVGRTIANAINTAIEFAYSFGVTFDFKNLGEAIANGINGFFENFNFTKLAKTINKWVEGLKTTIKTIIKKVKWDKVFGGIFDFFSNLSLDTYMIVGLANLTKIVALFRTLPTVLSKIGNVFSRLAGRGRDVVSAFHQIYALEGLGTTAGINAGIKELTKNLTTAQKALIGIGGAVAEFGLLSDGMRKIAKQTDDVSEAILEMIAGITAGAAGLTAVIGFPYGLIAAGIIGITASIVGLKKAFDDMRLEELGQVMYSSLVAPGGVPLENVFDSFMNKTSEAAENLLKFNQKSNELKTTQDNINEVTNEIYGIQRALDLGVEGAEEDIGKLSDLFSQLAILTEEKFSIITQGIISAVGENGVFHDALEAMGTDTQELIDITIDAQYSNTEAVRNIVAEMAELDPLSDRYKELSIQLQSYGVGLDDVEKKASALNYAISSIDYSSFLLDDGTLDADKLGDYLDSVAQKLSDYETELTTAGENYRSYLEELQRAPEITPDQLAVIENELGKIPDAVGQMKLDAETEVQGVIEVIQTDFLGKIPGTLDSGMTNIEGWFEDHPFYGWVDSWLNLKPGEEEKLIKSIDSTYDTLNEEIDRAFKDFETINTEKGRQVGESIVNSMFQIPDWESNAFALDTTGYAEDATSASQIRQSIRGFVDNLGEQIDAEVKNAHLGEYITLGTLAGTDEVPQSDYDNAFKPVLTKVINGAETVFQIDSPAKTMYETGEYIILGILEGFKEVDFVGKMSEWWDSNVKPFFSIEKWSEIGQNASDGILPQIDYMISTISSSFTQLASDISWVWYNMVDAVNDAMQNLKTPTFEIDGNFDFSKGKVPKVDVRFYAQGGFPQTGSLFYAGEAGAELLGSVGGRTAVASNGEITGISDTIRATSGEEITLLRQQNQLLQGILQKEFGITSGEIFRSVRTSAVEYTKMTGNPPF